ncbi:MAG: hypothetical protein ACM34K_03680 [Bacillota bacterium]
MNKNFLIIVLIFILPALRLMAQEECTSKLHIRSSDSLAIIFLDDFKAGQGSVLLDVKKGKHILKARSSSRQWNAEELIDTIYINDCGINKQFDLSFKRNIYINSNPSNAEVFYKDSLIGTTPLYLTSDIKKVDLKKKDYRGISIDTGQLSESSVIKMDFIGKKNGESFLKTNMFKILIGSALILGGTAAYYKLRANDYFDDYNLTGNKKALDQTNKFDTISGIAFGALQVDFGVILYYLLTEQ